MLVAVNPYEILPFYTNTQIAEYRSRKIGELPPHIFAIGDNSYVEMRETKKNQCVVIRYVQDRFRPVIMAINFLVAKAGLERPKAQNSSSNTLRWLAGNIPGSNNKSWSRIRF